MNLKELVEIANQKEYDAEDLNRMAKRLREADKEFGESMKKMQPDRNWYNRTYGEKNG